MNVEPAVESAPASAFGFAGGTLGLIYSGRDKEQAQKSTMEHLPVRSHPSQTRLLFTPRCPSKLGEGLVTAVALPHPPQLRRPS
ncbi:hypothetical protein NDU88_008636 [Pleurodeles waltl]|uniref:Uncharacterized protein n=1 Tax=Pleurodeles waltl TaxID=8319 RepID=A0AAV7NWN9_PLEWA|nr:hypothetical protein NDU88_008636 [Pleurodeles waltl]